MRLELRICVYTDSDRRVSLSACVAQYQLSLMDPRDGIVLLTERRHYCDKLVLDCRSSEVLST